MESSSPALGIGAAADGIFTVSGLNRAVSALLARSFPIVRVRGEVTGFTRAASGHWYFALKDGAAQARCVMFRGRNALLGFTPADGNRVVVIARLGLYEPRGEFQLAVEGLERDGTGQLYEEFLRRKARLEAEGLFDPGRRRPLPRVPRAVGVVTSLQAAALRDVVTTLGRRAPYVRLIVYPVPVQGNGAAESIAAMLRRCGERAEVDVLLLVRGGGSIEDLWSFNEEVVARAIAASPIPVVAGIGHESDFTIADFVADLRAPTPTAAAELVAPAAAELSKRVADALRRVHRAAAAGVQARAQRLDYASRSLQGPRAPMRGLADRVVRLSERAGRAAALTLERRVAAWQGVERMRQRSAPALDGLRLAVSRGRTAASAAVRRERTVLALRLDTAQRALAALDPEAVLRRGYGIVRRLDGRLVVDSRDVPAGTRVSLQFARGSALADVVERRGPDRAPDP